MNNDLIRRGELKEELHAWAVLLNRPSCYSVADADCVIDTMPAVDAVEVVRCKDCKHWSYAQSLGRHECNIFNGAYEFIGYPTKENDFCSYGEKKGGKL